MCQCSLEDDSFEDEQGIGMMKYHEQEIWSHHVFNQTLTKTLTERKIGCAVSIHACADTDRCACMSHVGAGVSHMFWHRKWTLAPSAFSC